MTSNNLDTVKTVLKSLLISSPKELTYHQLNTDYKACEGDYIPFSKLGYHNLQAFLLSLQDTLTLNCHTGVVTAVVSENSKNAHVYKLVKEQKPPKQKPRPRRGQGNSNRLQTKTPQIWDTLPSAAPLYEHYPNIPTSPQKYNMNNLSMKQMQLGRKWEPGNLLQLPHISMWNMLYRQSLPMVPTQLTPNASPSRSSRSNGKNEKKNENVKSPNRIASAPDQRNVSKSPNRMASATDQQNSFGEMSGRSEKTVALPILDDLDPIHLIGDAYSNGKFGQSIPAAEYPIALKSGDIHQINIKEITTMWHFFFQFFENQDHLDDMHAEISEYCVTRSLDMIVHPFQLQIGNVCAAFFSDKWLRAQVLGKPIDDLVKLLFVDFGTIENVSIRNCRWLLAKFCEVPRFSHRGALAFLEPIDNYKIEKVITKTFCKMVRDKSMMGVILEIDTRKTILMTVIDTSQDDVIINKVLSDSLLIARTLNKPIVN